MPIFEREGGLYFLQGRFIYFAPPVIFQEILNTGWPGQQGNHGLHLLLHVREEYAKGSERTVTAAAWSFACAWQDSDERYLCLQSHTVHATFPRRVDC